MDEMFGRDPEEVGPEHPDDLNNRMRFQESIHTFDPVKGRCTICGSTQRSSVLHDDPESDFRMMHNHGGRDCMCFEDEDGPSYYEAMKAYVAGRS